MHNYRSFSLLMILFFFIGTSILFSQEQKTEENYRALFEQLGTQLPSPNAYRTASGAPGESYWQQKADYKINVRLDDENQRIEGSEQITYYNNAPQTLRYLWVQLDQNVRAKDSDSPKISSIGQLPDSLAGKIFQQYVNQNNHFEGGFILEFVRDTEDRPLKHIINKTMMRIELPEALKTGQQFSFRIGWSYNINDRMDDGGRSGYEYFPKDDNYLYTIAQFYPRMAAYTDAEGWQNKQFLGQGEFALTFGDFEVEITVPADHLVAATGVLRNAKEVLSETQFNRYQKANVTTDKPVLIVTEKEAKANEKSRSKEEKTWRFEAENVRDFAFASSRKFIWDAMSVPLANGNKTLAMSFYPKEGNPLWEKESTLAVKNTLEVYSERTFDYPYPVAISVHAASIGMEYPMICFNYGRPREDGSYSDGLKWGMITVIVHEVGHNFFPMIVNSDERQWTWMDEGLNTYLETQTLWERYIDYTGTWGTPASVAQYMKNAPYLRPIMTNSENVQRNNFGYNAYGKPAAALNLLRETIMGPELFDYAFKEYANRWMFKHPTPADFFRTMEDASAVDLDWFWKAWFFTTDHVDISIDEVVHFQVAKIDAPKEQANQEVPLNEEGEELTDLTRFIQGPKQITITDTPSYYYGEFRNAVDQAMIQTTSENKEYYQVKFSNKGGIPSPIIVEFEFEDGSTQTEYVPAEIWRVNEQEVNKIFILDKKVVSVRMDPANKLGDAEEENNIFPRVENPESRFDLFNKDE